MKIKLNCIKKSLAIALLMTTHLTTTPVLCMDGVSSETMQAVAAQPIAIPDCIQTSRIAFDSLSLSDKIIITRHIESLPSIQVDGATLNCLSAFLKKCIKNRPQESFENLVQHAISTREFL
jgi:hypothetical protein